MKNILFIVISLLLFNRVFSQTTPPPVNPQQVNTMTWYTEPSTKKMFAYRGSTLLWWQPTDSLQVKRMIINSGLGSGTVTSITPGIGFTSHTPITTSGTLNIDTALIGSGFAKLNGGNIFNSDQTVHGYVIIPDANKGIALANSGIGNGSTAMTIDLGDRNGLFVRYHGQILFTAAGDGYAADDASVRSWIKFAAKPSGISKYYADSDRKFLTGSMDGNGHITLDTVGYGSLVKTSEQNQTPYGTLYNKNSWTSLADFATPTATVSVVGNALSFSGGTSDFTKTLNLSSYTMLDKQVITISGRPTTTSSSFGPTTGSGSPATAIFNRTGTSGTIELYVGNSILVATSPVLTFSAGDRIVITMERDGTYLKANAYNQTTRSSSVTAYYNYNTTITSNPLLPRTGQVGIVSYSGTFTIDSIKYATSAIKNAQIAVMGTSKSQYYDVSDVSKGYVTILGSKYGNILQHSGQSDATAQALLSLPELISLSPKIVLDEMECNDVRLGVPIATTMANVRNYTNQLNAAGITVYHLLPFYEKVGTGGAVNLQPLVDSLKAAFPTTYIDTYTPTYNCASCIAADGVHVTDEGNSVIANTIINFFNDKITPGKNINQSFQAFKGITTESVTINDNITSSSTAGTNYLNSLVNAYPTGNAFASLSVGENSTNRYMAMTYENSTFVTSGINQPNTGYLVTGTNASGGMVMSATGVAPIKFATNGIFREAISSAGNHLFGTTTDASTGIIQATGNVTITGNINATTYGAINSTGTITSTGNAINSFAAVNSGTASNQFYKGRVNNVDVFAAGWDLSTNSVYSGAIDSRIYALRTANTDRIQISAAGFVTITGLNTAGAVVTNGSGTLSTGTLVVSNGGTGRSTITIGALQKGGATTTSALVDAVAGVDYLTTSTLPEKFIRLTGSGTGSATTISIPHGLSGVTSASIALVTPINAASSGIQYVTCDSTNINIVYSIAPASGASNLSYNVTIKP